jgi:molecular chaperone GrpE
MLGKLRGLIMTDASDAESAATAAESGAEIMADLEARLAERDAQVSELNDRVLRLAAEMENVRRRLEKEKQDASIFAVSSFARDMLAVADNLRRALQSLPEAARSDAALGPVVTGVEMTEKELVQVFGRFGISRIEAIGARLDPNQHQAVGEVESATDAPGTITMVLQDGYMLKERLLRPAMVMVAKAGSGEATPASSDPGGRVDVTA